MTPTSLMSVDITVAERTDEKIKEFSVNIVAFISCRGRLTKVLPGAAKGETGSKGGGSRVRLSDFLKSRCFLGINIR